MFELLGVLSGMPSSELNFFLNAGLAGLFAVFAIILFNKFLTFLEKQEDKREVFFGSQTALWQAFMKEQRENHAILMQRVVDSHNAGLARLAEELKSNTLAVGVNRVMLEKLDTNLDRHMESVQTAIPVMQKVVRKIEELPGQKERSRPKPQGATD